MNSPEEKAKELVDKFMDTSYIPWYGGKDEATQEDCAKDAALICVDEIIAVLGEDNEVLIDGEYPRIMFQNEEKIKYYQRVKEYIQIQ